MKIQIYNFMVLPLVVLILISCNRKGDIEYGLKEYDDYSYIVNIIMDENEKYEIESPFFVMSKSVCPSCINEVLEKLNQGNYLDRLGELNIVLLGANNDEIKRLNAIYRNRVNYIYIDISSYDLSNIESFFLFGVELDSTGYFIHSNGNRKNSIYDNMISVVESTLSISISGN